MSLKDPKGRLARWALQLQQHDFTIVHRPGKQHQNADAISRFPVVAALPSGYSSETIKANQHSDSFLYYIIHHLKTGNVHEDDPQPKVTILSVDNYFLDDHDVLYHISTPDSGRKSSSLIQLVVPANLKFELLAWFHDHLINTD